MLLCRSHTRRSSAAMSCESPWSVRRQLRDKYPAMIATWDSARNDFVPFLDFPVELHQLDQLDREPERAVPHSGPAPVPFPAEQAAPKIALPDSDRKEEESLEPDRPNQRLEAHPEHLDHPLRRPHRGRQLTMSITPGYTSDRIRPLSAADCPFGLPLAFAFDKRLCTPIRSRRARAEYVGGHVGRARGGTREAGSAASARRPFCRIRATAT